MNKYNNMELLDVANLLKIRTEEYSEYMYELSNNIYNLINLPETTFKHALADNTKLYMEEVVMGAMQAMVIGVYSYTENFIKLQERALLEIENSENANITYDGLYIASDNAYKIKSELDLHISSLNTCLGKIRQNGGCINDFDGTLVNDTFAEINRYLISDLRDGRLANFSATDEIMAITELFSSIEKFIDHISNCIKNGEIVYDESNRINTKDWYADYEKIAVQAIFEIGTTYFVNRSTEYELSSVELKALSDLLLKIYNESDGDSLSILFTDKYGVYDPHRVKLIEDSIKRLLDEYVSIDGDFSARYRVLVQFKYIFEAVGYEMNRLPFGSKKTVTINIDRDPRVGSIITIVMDHSYVRQPKGEWVAGSKTLVTGIPNFGSLSFWLELVGPQGDYKSHPTTYREEFTKYIMNQLISHGDRTGAIAIGESIVDLFAIPKKVSYDHAIQYGYVYDMLGYYAIPTLSVPYSLDIILYPSAYSQLALDALNKEYPDLNVSIEDLDNDEVLIEIKRSLEELEKIFNENATNSLTSESGLSSCMHDFLRSGGTKDCRIN